MRLRYFSAFVALVMWGPLCVNALGQEGAAETRPRVKIETNLGDIIVELRPDKAPMTVYNFLRYVQDGFYDGTIFHRVKKDELIQGGGFYEGLDEKRTGLYAPIPNEWRNGLKNLRGAIAAARVVGSLEQAQSQFFINVDDNPKFDRPQVDGAGFAVFGRVVEGMDVVDQMRSVATGVHIKYLEGPVVPRQLILIEFAEILGDYKLEQAEALALAAEKRYRGDAEASQAADAKLIEQFVARMEKETGAKAATTESGLIYLDLVVGGGASPTPQDRVEVHYVARLADGTEFHNSYKNNATLIKPLHLLLNGWIEGLSTMKVGGKRILVLPPQLAYGDEGAPPHIKPGAWLIFEIELVSIPENARGGKSD